MAANGGSKQLIDYRQSLCAQAFGIQNKGTPQNPVRAMKERAKKAKLK